MKGHLLAYWSIRGWLNVELVANVWLNAWLGKGWCLAASPRNARKSDRLE